MPMVRPGDASVAAPFTSKDPSWAAVRSNPRAPLLGGSFRQELRRPHPAGPLHIAERLAAAANHDVSGHGLLARQVNILAVAQDLDPNLAHLRLNCIINAYVLSALSLEGSRTSERPTGVRSPLVGGEALLARQIMASHWLLSTASLAFAYASPCAPGCNCGTWANADLGSKTLAR